MNEKKEFEDFIARVKRAGAGIYGTKHFMCLKHEHWKFLWAAERIAELEAENNILREALEMEVISNGRDNLGWQPAAHIAQRALEKSDG